MLKLLVKKQLYEVFRSYFYDAKKNKMRSKGAIAAYFIFYAIVMLGVLGGMFTYLSLNLCGSLNAAGMGWLYFLLMGIIAIFLGAFGSVFNTYASLYISKDNDLLLSLPIPIRIIIASRLMNVYLLGAMYSVVVILPALIVYWITVGFTVSRLLAGLLFTLLLTVIVLLLSCLLGWVVAKASLRLKNKSFVTVLISLICIGLYYFVYFQAAGLIQTIIQNASVYGEQIKGAAYGLYLFGRVAEGDWLAAGILTGCTALLSGLVWLLLSHSFLKIATSTPSAGKIRYREKAVRPKSVFSALLSKELSRFTSSANYMLNCGLGVLMLAAVGVLLLIYGQTFFGVLDNVLSDMPGAVAVLLCAAFMSMQTMCDMAAPSVSLEGNSLWLLQSLPVRPKTVLHAKAALQLILTVLPTLFAAVCAALTSQLPMDMILPMIAMPLASAVFFTLFDTAIGVRMALLNWTTETAPIKQGGAVGLSLLVCFLLTALFAGVFFLLAYPMGAAGYLWLWTGLLATASILILRWLDTKGAETLATL